MEISEGAETMNETPVKAIDTFLLPQNIDEIISNHNRSVFPAANIPGAHFSVNDLPCLDEDRKLPKATQPSQMMLYTDEQFNEFSKRVDEYMEGANENIPDAIVIRKRKETWHKFFQLYGGKASALSRFLCAREGQVDQALTMIKECVQFREEKGVANILSATDDRNNVIKYIRQFWPATFFGITGNGSPVQYHHLRNIDVGKLCAPGEDNLRVFYLWWMENCLQLQRAGHSKVGNSDGPMCQSIEIYDFKDVSLWTMSYNIFGLRMFSRALDVGQDNYPENLNKAFIINAPTVVTILWSIVLKTLSERTKSKISLTGHDNREGLREFLSDETIDRLFAM